MKTSNLRSLTTLELGASKSKSLYYYLWLFLMTTWLLLMFIVQLHHSCSVVEYFILVVWCNISTLAPTCIPMEV